MTTDYSDVTEIAGTPITREQLFRLHHRYEWAGQYCKGRDVVEAACGTGPGLGLLHKFSRSFEAGDVSAPMVAAASRHYGDRIRVSQFDAQLLPFPDRSKDVVVLFEAIYYLPNAAAFVEECARVLRPGGHILIVTANKDLWDFHPSPHTHKYFGVIELGSLLNSRNFDCEYFGFQNANRGSLRSLLLRPVKRLAVLAGVIPKTMSGKRWLKRIVFGAEVQMPPELLSGEMEHTPPESIQPNRPDKTHKIIYCAAKLRS